MKAPMRTTPAADKVLKLVAYFVLLALPLNAAQTAAEEISTRSVVSRGAHFTTWQNVQTRTDSRGQLVSRTNTIQELATGLNYQDERGNWHPSSDEIEIFEAGARVTQTAHKANFPANLNVQAAITVTTPEGAPFSTTPVGLAYTDTRSGESVWIAEIQDCQGVVYPPNMVAYPEAFTDIKAEVQYVNKMDRVESFVVLRERIPSPEIYGLSPATTILECWTEV